MKPAMVKVPRLCCVEGCRRVSAVAKNVLNGIWLTQCQPCSNAGKDISVNRAIEQSREVLDEEVKVEIVHQPRSEWPEDVRDKLTPPPAQIPEFHEDDIRRCFLPKDVMGLIHDLVYHHDGRDVNSYVVRAQEILKVDNRTAKMKALADGRRL